MSDTYRKSDGFGDKKHSREVRKLQKRNKKRQKRAIKQQERGNDVDNC